MKKTIEEYKKDLEEFERMYKTCPSYDYESRKELSAMIRMTELQIQKIKKI